MRRQPIAHLPPAPQMALTLPLAPGQAALVVARKSSIEARQAP
jgi:hypothetical protein